MKLIVPDGGANLAYFSILQSFLFFGYLCRMVQFKNSFKSVSLAVLLALSLSHLINDLLQATVAASYPILKGDLDLTFAQIGSISFLYQISASVFQPLVGMFFDRHPFRWSVILATSFTAAGIVSLSMASTLTMVHVSVFMVGVGSSIFHPEASRITSLASGGKRGLAQSIFQVGGNFGGSIGPLLVAVIVAPFMRRNLLWFLAFSCLSFLSVSYVSSWFGKFMRGHSSSRSPRTMCERPLGPAATVSVIVLICILIISKYIYLESLRSYYTFYLMEKFHMSVQISQICLFIFLFATAAGTLVGGPLGDRIGRKFVILISILGTAPFSILLPGAGLPATIVLSFCAGFVLSSAFPSILLYAQELLPNRLGLVSGLFFGFAFGVGGIVSAILGKTIDIHGIEFVYRLVSFLPLIGLMAVFLPDLSCRGVNKDSKN